MLIATSQQNQREDVGIDVSRRQRRSVRLCFEAVVPRGCSKEVHTLDFSDYVCRDVDIILALLGRADAASMLERAGIVFRANM